MSEEFVPDALPMKSNEQAPIDTADEAEAKRDALSRKLIEIAKDIDESPIENFWHIEELAQHIRKLHYMVRMASYQ